jgi:1,4-alpha-glucan branching enzyme
VRATLRDLNRLYRQHSALGSQDFSSAGFQWLAWDDAGGNMLSFLRWGGQGTVVACVVNFSGVPKQRYRIGLPHPGRWAEVLNTDATCYGGSGVGNLGAVTAGGPPYHGQPTSVALEIGPYAAHWLVPAG